MKYIILLCDGMSDYPVPELGGLTPMQKADKPHMNALAAAGFQGLCKTVPDGMKPGSDVANLSALGFDPAECYTGRSPLEAASLGIEMSDTDVALRCNLVTLSNDGAYSQKQMMDYSGGEISTADAAVLINDVRAWAKQRLEKEKFDLAAGTAYRHCLIWHNGISAGYTLTPPHDISGKIIGNHLNWSPDVAWLTALQRDSFDFLSAHPLNLAREKAGKRPANSLWFWGQGTRPKLRRFVDRFGLSGACVSAVDLIKGIGRLTGLKVCEVPGATGYLDTNFEGKAAAALGCLETVDFVFIHIEAPDECGHRFEVENKVKAIEEIDRRVLKPLLDGLTGEYRILIMPDHPTPLSTGTHAADPVPFLISSGPGDGTAVRFDEESAANSGVYYGSGFELIQTFLNKNAHT